MEAGQLWIPTPESIILYTFLIVHGWDVCFLKSIYCYVNMGDGTSIFLAKQIQAACVIVEPMC